jgi:hypothetical protein
LASSTGVQCWCLLKHMAARARPWWRCKLANVTGALLLPRVLGRVALPFHALQRLTVEGSSRRRLRCSLRHRCAAALRSLELSFPQCHRSPRRTTTTSP